MNSFLVQIVFSYIATFSAAFVLNVPRKMLNLTSITGMIGWLSYWLVKLALDNGLLANFTGGLMVGIVALIFSRKTGISSIIFAIPALIPLVPGATAYQSLMFQISGQTIAALNKLFLVVMYAGSIALGYILSQFVTEQYVRIVDGVTMTVNNKFKK
ncbi:threonine/serine exporter family protein [Streptococcaceae bacterium ESL0729]|nr:threonine/serine exporter family protein [Streptococcaceae bacterium ESL0729]